MFDVRQEKSKKSHPECNRGGARGDDLAGRLRSCGVRKRRETRGPGLRRVRRRLARSRRPGRLRLNHREHVLLPNSLERSHPDPPRGKKTRRHDPTRTYGEDPRASGQASPASGYGSATSRPGERLPGLALLRLASAQVFGARIAVIRRPSIEGFFSSLPTSSRAWSTSSMTLRPSSMWASSRPRNRTFTSTLSLCSRNSRARLTLTSMSWSPVLGRTRISLTWIWCCFCLESFFFWVYLNLP